MTHERFKELIAAYGTDPRRWPAAERDDALDLLARMPALQSEIDRMTLVDAALDSWPNPAPLVLDPAALAARVSTTPQRRAAEIQTVRRFRWPAIAWPNAAGLAAAALAGFLVGWSGLDSSLLPASAETVDQAVVATIIEDATW
jgi:hypothetical protein